MIFLWALAAWAIVAIPFAVACGRLIRHGEQQTRHDRRARHARRHTPSGARTDRHGD
ncbi:hypothetical protein GTW69_38485 [Streptomyces sp. SID7760]|nr:hypothetical protein [Streptomyces sp. SID7760]